MTRMRKRIRKRTLKKSRKGGAALSNEENGEKPKDLHDLELELTGKMNDANLRFLVGTYSMVLGYKHNKRTELMSEILQECAMTNSIRKYIGWYKEEFERKELLSAVDYSGVNSLLKRLERGHKLTYFSGVLNKIWKFTVVEPPSELNPFPNPEEKLRLFKCMLTKLYYRALELDQVVGELKPVDHLTLWRGVKGSNLAEIEGLTTEGTKYTFNYKQKV